MHCTLPKVRTNFISVISHVFCINFLFFTRWRVKREQVRNEAIEVMDIARGEEEGTMSPIVPVHSSEWSFFSFIMCSVAMAFKANIAPPKPKLKVPSLMGLAGAAVQTHCEYK